jgi:hypothetical protein
MAQALPVTFSEALNVSACPWFPPMGSANRRLRAAQY